MMCSGESSSCRVEMTMKIKNVIAIGVLGVGVVIAGSSASADVLLIPEQQFEQAKSVILFNKTITTGKAGENDFNYEQKGTGFVYGDKYITVDHVVSTYNYTYHYMAPWGPEQGTAPIVEREEKTFVLIPGEGEFELEEIINDRERDMAVFQLPQEVCDLGYCDKIYPYKLKKDVKIGDEVYWSANPGNQGHHYRKSYVSRLENLPSLTKDIYNSSGLTDSMIQNSIGLGTHIIQGSSGNPVFDNETGALVGVIKFGLGTELGTLGYMQSIDLFEPYLTGNHSK